jgi:uncharacterized protein YprB with RNaseH-like and TPR domain
LFQQPLQRSTQSDFTGKRKSKHYDQHHAGRQSDVIQSDLLSLMDRAHKQTLRQSSVRPRIAEFLTQKY